jgi:hypothetical protein
VEAETGAQGLVEEVWAFDSDQPGGTLTGVSDGSTQFFQAAVLLTLYNTKRHLKRTISALSRFYAVLIRRELPCDAHHLPAAAGCDSFRLCGVCICGGFSSDVALLTGCDASTSRIEARLTGSVMG